MLPPGTRIDRYEVLHALGQGGMAWVFAARHASLGTLHALKVLHAHRQRARFELEGQLQATLDPQLVVPVTEVVEHQGIPVLVMPLVQGCTLQQLLDTRRLEASEVVALGMDIVAAAAAAHATGVVHRDLKPANVLLEVRHGVLVTRLSDFGIAKPATSALTETGAFLGTPGFAAPEQLTDAASVDHRADLFAIGVMLYTMVVGERPFRGPVLVEPAFDPVPERWRSLLRGLLQADPKARPSGADVVHDALRALGPGPALQTGHPLVDEVEQLWDTHRAREMASARALSAETLADVSPLQSQPPTGLTPERDPFVGRAADLADLGHLLEDAPVVVVVGMGGVGKSRLALRCAHRYRASWPGGVWRCDAVEDEGLGGLTTSVARALGIQLDATEPVEQVGRALAGRERCLLVVDQAEHVGHELQSALASWRAQAPRATFLFTSRRMLDLPEAAVFPLDVLTPHDAAALFSTRLGDVDEGDEASVLELVQLLDGLPLALELAAARARVFGIPEVQDRMKDRFALLVSRGRRDRQSTLHATLSWSWEQLAPWGQEALAHLSVFEGGFTLDAAQAVLRLDGDAPWTIDVLQELVDHSLVRARGHGRFDLLRTVQDFAARQLTDPEPVRVRHGAHFAEFGTSAAVDALERPDGRRRVRRLLAERRNLFAACERALARGHVSVAQHTAVAAWQVARRTGPFQRGLQLLERVAALEPSARIHLEAAAAHLTAGDVGAAERHLALAAPMTDETTEAEYLRYRGAVAAAAEPPREQEAQQRLLEARHRFEAQGRRLEAARVINHLGTLAMRHRPDEAREHYEAALEGFRARGSDDGMATVHGNLGVLANRQGRLDEAVRHFEASRSMHQANGVIRGVAVALGNLSIVAHKQGHLDRATSLALEALEVWRRVGHRRPQRKLRHDLVAMEGSRGHFREALGHARELLALAQELAEPNNELEARLQVAIMLEQLGRYDASEEHLLACVAGGTDTLRGYAHLELAIVYTLMRRPADARAQLDLAAGIAEETANRTLHGSQLGNRAYLAYHQGEWDDAEAYARAAMAEFPDRPVALGVSHGLLALVALARGDEATTFAALDAAEAHLGSTDHQPLRCEVACTRVRAEAARNDHPAAREALARAEALAVTIDVAPGSRMSEVIEAARREVVRP